MDKHFRDYHDDAPIWITLSSGEYYPDILPDACQLYAPVLTRFSQLLSESESSSALLHNISDITPQWMRIQLLRVFRKYVCPVLSVEMLKKKGKINSICEQFGSQFRPIQQVQKAFSSRPIPDEALCAILWEYKDRGKKGYDLTDKFFSMMSELFPEYTVEGPRGAGKDIQMGSVFIDYPNPKRPVDFIIYDHDKTSVYAIGLARYDSDRGGAQEDDRTGGYNSCADEILSYAEDHGMDVKVIFLNDGPGLLLGSMWEDYSHLEEKWDGKIMVLTLRMIPDRLNKEWIEGRDDNGDRNSD